MEYTKIIIAHETTKALKDHPIWALVMELFMMDGAVSVTQISECDESEGDR